MKCPECSKLLDAHINEHQDDSNDFVDVEFHCPSGHSYFSRISEDGLTLV